MRDLRKVNVESAVFSVPHSKGVARMPDNLHASTPLRRALSRAAGHVSHLYRETTGRHAFPRHWANRLS
jgi:hypothetical protein